jgi:hypothetical protein
MLCVAVRVNCMGASFPGATAPLTSRALRAGSTAGRASASERSRSCAGNMRYVSASRAGGACATERGGEHLRPGVEVLEGGELREDRLEVHWSEAVDQRCAEGG